MTWTWYLLSQHPLIEDRLHTELNQVLAGQAPSIEHLASLPYTRMILDETLRLYPPTFSLSRKALVDDEIGGYAIPAKSTILLCPYTTHRTRHSGKILKSSTRIAFSLSVPLVVRISPTFPLEVGHASA